MVRPPKLDSLRMFDVSARRLNFRLAAQELNLTQSAIAQRVRQLEQELGVALFIRKPRGLELTEAGRHYHSTISQALAMIDEATRGLSSKERRLTISVTPSFAAKWLVPRLGDFREKHPHLELQLEASERLANFRSDGVDFAIRMGEPPFGKGLNHELFTTLKLCAVCSPSYLSQHGEKRSLENISGHLLITDPHDHWAHFYPDTANQSRTAGLHVSHTSLAIDAAKAGQGVTITPRLFVNHDIETGELLLLRQFSDDKRGFYLVFPETRLPDAQNLLIPWLRSRIEPQIAPEHHEKKSGSFSSIMKE